MDVGVVLSLSEHENTSRTSVRLVVDFSRMRSICGFQTERDNLAVVVDSQCF